ncbi:MAG: bifunctional glutamate N-acetyltransferase/amino-acid acetyltransferase ArgJ [Acidobacteria bacterium]|nr:bifunctional glutamate N-acetyltransferase/amino-acid acetyltransferase ArgJ [Acidobacteriota bacterium]
MSAHELPELPRGFRFAACYAGIRKKPKADLTLMVSETPAAAAGVFTRNLVRAAPVDRSARHLKKSGGLARAIVCNAGNANCATPDMDAVAKRTADAASSLLKSPKEQILLASTGVIGEPLEVGKIVENLPRLQMALAPENFRAAAEAIMTTDTVPKMAFASVETAEGTIRIAGMTKGSGMIQPNMATMLAFVFTDADLKPSALQKMLGEAVEPTFNSISVDSDTSTNDTVFLLANGASGVRPKKGDRAAFQKALTSVCEQLAVAIVRDGEGASKLLTIYVDGAPSDADAKRIAREIANSPLVKTALAGEDPNWGRILPAAGKSGVAFDPMQVDISLNGFLVCEGGVRANFVEAEVQQSMREKESVLRFAIRGKGEGSAKFWTCDFTEAYIKINAEYRT